MLKFYNEYYHTYYHGERAGTYVHMICEDNAPEDRVIKITWDNLSEIYSELGCVLPFNVWNFKGGRRISFLNFDYRDIKEKKQPVLDMEVRVTTKECNPPIQEILEYRDGEKAIRYLVERGLSIVTNH